MKIFKILFWLITFAVATTEAQTLKQSMLFDFGPNDITNGNITASPDANGNYWNCPITPTTAAPAIALVTTSNVATGYSFQVTTNMTANGIVSGGLLAPSAALLGDFAINTATQDYFFTGTTGSVKISGLNPTNGYKFHLFGSRASTETRIALYTFIGLTTTSGTLQTSGTNLGGAGINGNNSTIYSTDYLFPDGSGNITITIAKQTGTYAHLNVMKVEEYDGMPLVDVTSISISGADITQSGIASQMSANVIPANATIKAVNWSVDDESIATIDANGLLKPVSNGTVTITATTKQSNLSIATTKQINISNQITTLFFGGDAGETGTDLTNAAPMKMVTDSKGSISNIFEIYTSLNATGTFAFYTSKDILTTSMYGDAGTAGLITLNGTAIDPSETGTVLITVDIATGAYTILPITKWSIVGNTIPSGWSGDIPLNYQGNGIWSANIDMLTTTTESQRFIFRANGSWSYNIKRIKGTTNGVMMESQAATNGVVVEDIGLNNGSFNITLNLRNYTYAITCASIDALKITTMGSSVANGQGATNMQGYSYQFAQLLAQQQLNGQGLPFNYANVSVNGNNTTNLLDRWEKDLISSCGKYVIYGVSLGNEGIHENGQPSFDSYLKNMKILIDKARARGMVPVVCNSYTRADFNATDYNYIKQMDLLIHEWDVPSINLLGAIDDGTGKWTIGYQAGDIYHPNDAGHMEFFYAMVPSLFDALEAGKPLPAKVNNTYLSMDNSVNKQIMEITPQNIIHSFTTSFDIRTTTSGTVARFKQAEQYGDLLIDNSTGAITFVSPNGGTLLGTTNVADGEWHKITLTHFYARGETTLYCDNVAIGSLYEKLVAETFYLNDISAPQTIDYRDWFFYRSGMNIEEVEALNEGRMLKSSLELYAPLDGEAILGANPLINLAQSTNTITVKTILPTSIVDDKSNFNFTISPNPVVEKSTIEYSIQTAGEVDITLYDLAGDKLVNLTHGFQQAGEHKMVWRSATNNQTLKQGVYLCRLKAPNGEQVCKIIISH